jgi:hypothetical protein
MANVRLEPTIKLIERLPAILDDPDRDRILFRLAEVQLDAAEAAKLFEHIQTLADVWDQLPSRLKTRADGVLWRLIRSLPEPYQSKVGFSFLVHHRKRRRIAAYRILSQAELPLSALNHLVALYESTSDEDLLHLIVRSAPLVAAFDEHYLLREIRSPYWQMRVIEALLKEAPERATSLASQYPRRFVHAVGRLQAAEHLPLLRQLFADNRHDTRLLGIYAWTIGRVGDTAALKEVRDEILELRGRLQNSDA